MIDRLRWIGYLVRHDKPVRAFPQEALKVTGPGHKVRLEKSLGHVRLGARVCGARRASRAAHFVPHVPIKDLVPVGSDVDKELVHTFDGGPLVRVGAIQVRHGRQVSANGPRLWQPEYLPVRSRACLPAQGARRPYAAVSLSFDEHRQLAKGQCRLFGVPVPGVGVLVRESGDLHDQPWKLAQPLYGKIVQCIRCHARRVTGVLRETCCWCVTEHLRLCAPS